MSQQNRTVLKTYFQTGDIPTQAEFADLIDSCYNISNDSQPDVGLANINNEAVQSTASITFVNATNNLVPITKTGVYEVEVYFELTSSGTGVSMEAKLMIDAVEVCISRSYIIGATFYNALFFKTMRISKNNDDTININLQFRTSSAPSPASIRRIRINLILVN